MLFQAVFDLDRGPASKQPKADVASSLHIYLFYLLFLSCCRYHVLAMKQQHQDNTSNQAGT